MNLRKIALLFTLLIPSALLHSQSMTAVSASKVADSFGRPILSAKLCFAPVDANGKPLGFRTGVIQVAPTPVCGFILNGSLESGLSVYDTSVTVPANVRYHIYAIDIRNALNVYRDWGEANISGPSWSLDSFDPTTTALLPITYTGTPIPGGANGSVQYNNNGLLGGYTTLPLSVGGTNATNAPQALANLGALAVQNPSFAGQLTGPQIGAVFQVGSMAGSTFDAQLTSCLNAVAAITAPFGSGGVCDARTVADSIVAVAGNVTISVPNVHIYLPCGSINLNNYQLIVTAGTRNVNLNGCSYQGGTNNGSAGGTSINYTGNASAIVVGDPTFQQNTNGFHMDNVRLDTSAAGPTAVGITFDRTEEIDLRSLYLTTILASNNSQTGISLDGTGNYSGGTFDSITINGFATGLGLTGANPYEYCGSSSCSNEPIGDYSNASTFTRLHIVCPTSSGSPMAGTYGVYAYAADGNTWTGGDVEGCGTMFWLGPHAENNTIVGLRNENSIHQYIAATGSTFNSVVTGGTFFTGDLIDQGSRNSFWDAFHRTINGMNGDWYASQQDATLTNHQRLGIGLGNERGLLNEIQTDYGYRWLYGFSDATAGEQLYQIEDLLNNVYRLSIGQYNNGQSSTNNQTVLNAAGTGAIVLNGSNNSGTGGVIFGSGGAAETTVALIDGNGNATFDGTLWVDGTTTHEGSVKIQNNADAEIDYVLQPGLTATQKAALVYKDYTGNSQWYAVKDQYNNWALNSAIDNTNHLKAYQNGDTYVQSAGAGTVRVNQDAGSGTGGFNVYSGGASPALWFSVGGSGYTKVTALAGTGHRCVFADSSGGLNVEGADCGTGSGSGSVTSVGLSLPADFTVTGSPVTGSGTLTAVRANENANVFLAGPASGGAASPTWRTIVAADIPTLNQSTTGNAATASALASAPGQCSGSNYSTGISASGAANCSQVTYAQLGGTTPTWNQSTTGNAATATNVSYSGLTGTVPTWNQNTTGTAAGITPAASIHIDNTSGSNYVCINCDNNSGTSGFVVQNGTGSSPSTEFQVTGSGNTTATGFLSGKFYIGNSSMSFAAGSSAGTGASAVCATSHSCTGAQGTVTLTSGTSTATGRILTVSFPNTHTNLADCVGNLFLAGTGQLSNWEPSYDTTHLYIAIDTTALAASTAYTYTYWCGGN